MTLAFDAHSYPGTATGDQSWTHTPVGTPRGVIVMIVQDDFTSDEVIGVTYGGQTMTEVALSPFFFTAPAFEKAVIYGYFLGSGIPTGAQTIAVDVDATGSAKTFAAITVTAATDTAVHDTSTLSTTSDSAPNVTMTVTVPTFAMAMLHSGNAVVSAITPGGAFTQIGETDFGGTVAGAIRSTSPHSASNYDVDWTSSLATSQGILGIAIREVSGVVSLSAIGATSATGEGHKESASSISAIGSLAATGDASFGNTITGTAAISAIGALSLSSYKASVDDPSISAVGSLAATATGTHASVAVISAVGRLTIPIVYLSFNRIIAPGKAGRVFHEIEYRGETYHPNVDSWQAEEEAPGGFGPATGRISNRVYSAHRDVFLAGANWYTFLEDGTCIHAGRMLEPDTAHGEIQLSDRGASRLADREVGPVLYQTHVGSELTRWFSDSERWRVSFPAMSHSGTGGGQNIMFDRTPDTAETSTTSGHVNIPFFGREPAFMRFKMQGRGRAYFWIQTRLRRRDADPNSSHELDMSTQHHEHYYFDFESAQVSEYVEVDLRFDASALPNPNHTVFTNVGVGADADLGGYAGVGDIITLSVEDGTFGSDASVGSVLLMNIEVNGTAVGEKEAFSAHDLVADIAALIGIRYTQIEGGSFNVLPYELPPGTPATEALDWASLVSGKRWRIRHNGNYPVLEFGSYGEHRWGLASPWSPFDAIPQERFDAVAIPYEYPSTQGQLTDQMIFKLKDSPLDRRNVYWELALQDPAHNQDQARAIAGRVAEELVRKRNAGSFAAASIIGPDGLEHSAHYVNAGDTLFPMREDEPGRLHIGRLTRFDDHVEGEFDGENRALARMLARREKKVARRKA